LIGIGVDLCEVPRLRATLARTPGVARRVFTEGERAYCERRRDPTERYAARFAAKEAVMKALGVGLGAFRFHDVEVVKARSGAPSIRLSGRAAELAAELGVTEWRLTMTHTASLAEAIAVAL
jgi:holo-[acyl-carrier protein] synthase